MGKIRRFKIVHIRLMAIEANASTEVERERADEAAADPDPPIEQSEPKLKSQVPLVPDGLTIQEYVLDAPHGMTVSFPRGS